LCLSRIVGARILQVLGMTAPIIGATKILRLKELLAAVEAPYQSRPIIGREQLSAKEMLKWIAVFQIAHRSTGGATSPNSTSLFRPVVRRDQRQF
jgi:hypothetical protein